jgi:hypothetical protein
MRPCLLMSTDKQLPDLTVAVPTFERAESLDTAIESILEQDYPRLKVIISDNGSTDDTQARCEQWSRVDRRVTWFRHDRNHGPNFNFNFLTRQSRTPLFMWHGDRDTMGAGYLRACAEALQRDPTISLAGGRCVFREPDGTTWEGERMHLVSALARDRVAGYYETVTNSGGFYGVWRRPALDRALPCDRLLGGDWYLMARGAALGSIVHLDEVVYTRRTGGGSRSYRDLIEVLGLPAWQAEAPIFTLARNTFFATASRRSLLPERGVTRWRWAWHCARIVFERLGEVDDPRRAAKTFARSLLRGMRQER